MIEVNGWQLFAHPLFLDQLEKLMLAVEKQKLKDPNSYQMTANAKVLAMIEHLTFVEIPQDPARSDYRQGRTLGAQHKHWFRAKFGNGRFRLFFRFDSRAKVIIYAWVNDQETLRTYGSKSDAYELFRKMLKAGNPPNDWQALIGAAREEAPSRRLAEIKGAPEPDEGRFGN